MHRMLAQLASGSSPRKWFPALLTVLALAAPARAAVEVTQETISEGLGGFGNATTKTTLIIAGDRSRSEDEYKYSGRFKTFMGGNNKSVSITRLSDEVIWNLDLEKKQYTETTFQEMRDILSGKGGPLGMPQAARMEEPGKGADVEMECSMDVSEPGEERDVNGFRCRNVVLTIRCDPKNPDMAGQKGAQPGRMIFDMWISKSVPGYEEMQAFQKAYAEKLGLGSQFAGGSGMARRMLGMAMKDLKEQFAKLEGYPIRTTFVMEQAPMTEEQKKAMEEAMARAETAQAENEAESEQQSAADAASGDMSGGAGRFLGSKLGGMFSRKARDEAKKSQDEPIFKVVTEVKGIKAAQAPAGSFEIPESFKKIDKPW